MKRIIKKYIKGLELPDLGIYDGNLAIFEQQAPDDQAWEWEGPQYGRILYDLLMKDDPERKVSGNLRILAAYENSDDGMGHENLVEAERMIQEAFDGTFFSTMNLTIAAAWRKTEPFSEKAGNESDIDVMGVILDFDVYAFPVMKYRPMDPVKSLALYINQRWPETKILNFGQLDEVWKPEEDAAVYIRLESITPGTFPSIHACTWHSAALKVHVISGAGHSADELSMALITDLSEKERFPMMNDGSPCFIQRCQFNKGLDVLKDGQVTIQGQYGVLREMEDAEPIRSISVESN